LRRRNAELQVMLELASRGWGAERIAREVLAQNLATVRLETAPGEPLHIHHGLYRRTVPKWGASHMRKIVLRCDSAEQLAALYSRATEAGRPSERIRHAGRTIGKPGTATCLGLGPASDSDLDAITGTLKRVD
jgi:peptidyl-tRNA hydrolase